jgi:hypothetical protein
MVFTLSFMLIVLICLSFIKFSVPIEVKSLVTVAPPLPPEIKNFVAESHKAQSKKPSKSKKPAQSKNPTNNSNDELTDNKPDEAVSNHFGGNGGGNEFGGGSNGEDSGGGDNDGGGGYGELVRLNAPKPPLQKIDNGGELCLKFAVDEKGKVLNTKILPTTTLIDENSKKQLKDFFNRKTEFKPQPGAPLRFHEWCITVIVG